MNPPWLMLAAAALRSRSLWVPFGAALLLALSACNGTAVVTLTSTPSTDTFLAYRVGLVAVQLQTSNGRTVSGVLSKGTTVDLAQLVDLSEVLGVVGIQAKHYQQVVVTLDYSSADIVYDDGSLNGVALTPLGASGQALGQVTLTLYLDPSNQFSIVRHSTSRLNLDFNLAASNIVNLAQKTVTVTPLIAASASPIDTKVVSVRGPLAGVDTSNTMFTTGITPFGFSTAESGQLGITPSNVTTYEINGTPATGSAGLTQLAAVSNGTMTVAFGTLTSSTDTNGTGVATCANGATPTIINGVSTCADGSTPTTTKNTTGTTRTTGVSFAATQVLAGGSVPGSGFDRISGIVSSRSGNTFTIEDGTLLANDGSNTFIAGTSVITIGPNTQVTQAGAGTTLANGLAQISVGSLVYAFGTASASGSSNETLDASAGRVQLWPTSASGSVTIQGTGTLTLTLSTLGGRSVAPFDFTGTGISPSYDASASAYQVATGNLDLTNATVTSPVEVVGYATAWGAASAQTPDFSASSLYDTTTINAKLVLNWGGGTPAPFASYSTSQIVLNARNSSIGVQHEIQIGAQTVNIVALAANPQIVPNATSTNTVYTIGHAASGTFENFITFSAFITQLQTELNGSVLATSITALGQYTTSSYSFSASSITLLLNN